MRPGNRPRRRRQGRAKERGGPHPAAVPDHEERRAPCRSQRAGPRIIARKRRSPSTMAIPGRPRRPRRARIRGRDASSPGTVTALVSVPIASSPAPRAGRRRRRPNRCAAGPDTWTPSCRCSGARSPLPDVAPLVERDGVVQAGLPGLYLRHLPPAAGRPASILRPRDRRGPPRRARPSAPGWRRARRPGPRSRRSGGSRRRRAGRCAPAPPRRPRRRIATGGAADAPRPIARTGAPRARGPARRTDRESRASGRVLDLDLLAEVYRSM